MKSLLAACLLTLGLSSTAVAQSRTIHIVDDSDQAGSELQTLKARVHKLEDEVQMLRAELAHLHEHLEAMHVAHAPAAVDAELQALQDAALAELDGLVIEVATVGEGDHSLEGHVCPDCGEVHGADGHTHDGHTHAELAHGHEHPEAEVTDEEVEALRDIALAELAELLHGAANEGGEEHAHDGHAHDGHVHEHSDEGGQVHEHGESHATDEAEKVAPPKKKLIARRKTSL